MLQTTRNSPIPELSVWAPLVLAILRIVSALLLIDQGLNTLLHFPQAGVPDGLDASAGVIEVVGGVLIAVGLYTRVAALAAAAEIAMAYGALDRPDTTILFCVIFFYLVFAGPGLWSLDGRTTRLMSGRRCRAMPLLLIIGILLPARCGLMMPFRPDRVTIETTAGETTAGKVFAER